MIYHGGGKGRFLLARFIPFLCAMGVLDILLDFSFVRFSNIFENVSQIIMWS